MSTIVTGVVPKPSSVAPDLSPAIEAIIMKALEKAPGDRYASALELGNALEQFAKAAGLSASTSALATYLVQHVGPRQEPWLVEGEQLHRVAIDFDSEEATDMTVIPTEVVEPKPTKPKLPPPKLAATPATVEKLVPAPPILPARTVPVSEVPTVTASIVVADEDVGAPVETSVEPDEPTEVSTPPPPPRAGRRSDLTAVVTPLSSPDTNTITTTPRKRLVIGAIGAGAIGLAIVVIAIATSADSKLAAMPHARSETVPTPAPRRVEPPTPTPVEPPTPMPVEPPTPVEVATPTPIEAPTPVAVAAPTPAEIAPPLRPSVKRPVAKKPIAKKPIAKPGLLRAARRVHREAVQRVDARGHHQSAIRGEIASEHPGQGLNRIARLVIHA